MVKAPHRGSGRASTGRSRWVALFLMGLGQLGIYGCASSTANLSNPTVNIILLNLPPGTVGKPYAAALTASGGVQPYHWRIVSGSLPAGPSLNPGDGAISGTPTAAEQSDLTILVTDSSPEQLSASTNASIDVSPPGPPPEALLVTSFGAAGDGVTDDAAALNAAIAALHAGETLYFPCGTYAIGSGLHPIELSNVTVEGPDTGPAPNCTTLKLTGSSSFTALELAGEGLGSSQSLITDTTANTFTVGPGGLAALEITPDSYVLVSDTAVRSNGPTSPLISTQQVAKVIAVDGDTATVEGKFAHAFTVISPHPSNQGSRPYVQKIRAPLANTAVSHLSFDGGQNTGAAPSALKVNYAVAAEIGFVTASNFLQTPGPTDTIILDVGYRNTFHDLICTACGNGQAANGHSIHILRQTLAVIHKIAITNREPQYSFGLDLANINSSMVSDVTVDQGGAAGRPSKLLRANYNTFNDVTAQNGGGGDNGISVTDISTHNVFTRCTARENTGGGITLFGNFNQHNTFDRCTAEFNGGQLIMGKDAFGNYEDDFTTVIGGTFCCARSASSLISVHSNDFTMKNAKVYDDLHLAPVGLHIVGDLEVVQMNSFSGLPSGYDIYAVDATDSKFSKNATPDGTTPTNLATLFRENHNILCRVTHAGGPKTP